MINKVTYYFISKDNRYVSDSKDNIEEIRKDAIEYKKNNKEKVLIYRNEFSLVLDKNGETIYSSDISIREFNTEEEVNENV